MATIDRSNKPTYATVAELLVTSPQAPYFRTSVRNVQTQLTAPAAPSQRGSERGTAPALAAPRPIITTSAPDLNILVRAANLYPFLIESDLVTARRDAMFGPLPGVVTARAIFAVASAFRFEPSDIPIIQIIGEGNTPREAARITQSTAEAFTSWIRTAQDQANLRPKERILISEIKRPAEIVVAGGTSTSLLVLVGASIALAFGALAVVLDRTFVAGSPETSQKGAAGGRAAVFSAYAPDLDGALGVRKPKAEEGGPPAQVEDLGVVQSGPETAVFLAPALDLDRALGVLEARR